MIQMTETAPGFRRVHVARAFEDIAGQIRDELTQGRLRAGDRLPPERELAGQFGVSRNTLREALRSLEISGLITLKKGALGGAYVKDSSGEVVVSGIRDMFALGAVTLAQITESRIWIESAIVRAACERHTEQDIARLRENMALAAVAVKRKDFFMRMEKHLEFHQILAKATGNPIMEVIMESLIAVMGQFIQTIGPNNIVDYALASRHRFMAHFAARDAESAVKEMENHLKRVNRNYLKVLGERGANKA